jgi:hypothetical protein
MSVKKIDFKKCPFCGSLAISACKITYRVGDECHEPCDCRDCERQWVTIYEPSYIVPDFLNDLDAVNNKQ